MTNVDLVPEKMVLQTQKLAMVIQILVEFQRCMKSSMGSGNGWRNGGKLEGTCKQWKVKEVIGFPNLC